MPTRKKPTPPSRSSLQEILDKGDRKDVRALFSFDRNDSEEKVLLKFNLWTRYFFPQYFKFKDAPFHHESDQSTYRAYRSILKIFVDIEFRGAAKTTRKKLWRAYAIANDLEHSRRYFKILTKDISNAKQIVTDIYNILINPRVFHFYPEIFKETNEKREETMGSFTTATGIKVRAGVVGVDQRGQLQEDARPDDIWFDDFETRKSLRSAVETQTIWDNMEEAKTGLSKDGSCTYTCNYLSERGNVHKLVEKKEDRKHLMIVPIRFNGLPMWPQAYTVAEIDSIERSAEDFEGEYLCEPSAGADILFDRSSLDSQRRKIPLRTIAGFKIFHLYDASHRYGSGHDVAGGVGLDSSTSVIIDFSTSPSRVVATFKSNDIKPDVFGDEIQNQLDRYGAPICAPENNNHGHATIGRLKQIYDNIFFMELKETRAGTPPKVRTYGWNTNADSKPKMLFALKKAVEDGHLELSDPDLINELRAYTRDDLMDKEIDPRLSTRHFDLLIAAAIAYQMRNYAEARREESYSTKQPDYESPTNS